MKTVLVFACVIFGAVPQCIGSTLLFGSDGGNYVTTRTLDDFPGLGQGVSVSTNTLLTGMAMYLNLPDGGDIKYMIWNGADTTLLFSETQEVAPDSALSFVMSTPFLFPLDAGSSYYFAVITDAQSPGMNVSTFYPPISLTQNGLSFDSTNSNYVDFANPMESPGGSTTGALELFGVQPTPEPGTLLLVFAALSILALRRIIRGSNPATRNRF